MQVAIPTNGKMGLGDSVAQHFGRCNTYTFLDEKGRVAKIIDNTSEHMAGLDLPPELMKAHGANILLCKELGPRALSLCEKLGIEVYLTEGGTVKDVFEKWQQNKCRKAGAEDVCEEHKL